MFSEPLTDGQTSFGAWWPISQMKKVRRGENPSREKAAARHGFPCLSAKEMRSGTIGILTQMWANLPQIGQESHPQIPPSKSVGSDVHRIRAQRVLSSNDNNKDYGGYCSLPSPPSVPGPGLSPSYSPPPGSSSDLLRQILR